MIQTKIIADSIYNGIRLTTFELEYPRYIHAEVMTHRVFSRNAQSSRAIPVSKSIEILQRSDWYPVFMKNKKGMSAEEAIDPSEIDLARRHWKEAKDNAILSAIKLNELGVHKQVVNRLLEPFSTIKVILTATEFDNFFELRLSGGAQQEIQLLANSMGRDMIISKPTLMDLGQWHLPYVSPEEEGLPLATKAMLSAARCARVSYLNHDGQRDIEKDIDLHNQLLSSKHMSPFEHQATPYPGGSFVNNFRGWAQYRKHLELGWKLK